MTDLFPGGYSVHKFNFSRCRFEYDLFEARCSLMIPESSLDILHVGDYVIIHEFDIHGNGYTGHFAICRVSSIFKLDDGSENALVGWEVSYSC